MWRWHWNSISCGPFILVRWELLFQLRRLHQTGLGAYLVWKDRHQIGVALGIFLQLTLAIYTQTVINPESPLSCGVGLKWFCLVAITLFSPHKLNGNNEIPETLGGSYSRYPLDKESINWRQTTTPSNKLFGTIGTCHIFLGFQKNICTYFFISSKKLN